MSKSFLTKGANTLSLKANADAEADEGRGMKGAMADSVEAGRSAGSVTGGEPKPSFLSALKSLKGKRGGGKLSVPSLAYGAKPEKL